MDYCTDCDRAPVAAYGTICAKCQSIREVMKESRTGGMIPVAIVAVGSCAVVVSLIILVFKVHPF